MTVKGEVPMIEEEDMDDLFAGVTMPVSGLKQTVRKTSKPMSQQKIVFTDLDEELGMTEILAIAILKQEWFEDSKIALIHEQECLSCGSLSTFSMGWFIGSHHARDKTARRMVRGEPLVYLPVVVQRVNCGAVNVCGNCAETHGTIERITKGFHEQDSEGSVGSLDVRIERKEVRTTQASFIGSETDSEGVSDESPDDRGRIRTEESFSE